MNSFGSDVNDLLIDACKQFAFVKPFEKIDKQRSFRAYLLPDKHPEYDDDAAPDWFSTYDRPRLAAREQAYRRGYDQGFYEAMKMLKLGAKPHEVEKRSAALHKWRVRQVQIIGSMPGSPEDEHELQLIHKRVIGSRLRWKILQRDNFRCQICGSAAEHNVNLEVDHKKSIYDGGSDEESNLWTLCFECNRGKHSDSI